MVSTPRRVPVPVVAGADIEAVGQTLGVLQAGIVAAVEEILQRAAHVTEIFRRPQNNGIGVENVLRLRLERALGDDAHAVAFQGVVRGRRRGVAQAPRVARRHMADNQELSRIVFAAHEDGIRFVGCSFMMHSASGWGILHHPFDLSVAEKRQRQAGQWRQYCCHCFDCRIPAPAYLLP